MTVFQLMAWPEALAAHGDGWRALGRERDLNPTLLPDWTRILVESLCNPADVQVLVGTDGGQLTNLLPFRLRQDRISGIPVRILEPISSLVSYHAEFVSRDGHAPLLEALVRSRDELPWDMARFAGVLTDGPTSRAIRAVAEADGLPLVHWTAEASPFLRLPAGVGGEQLMAGRRKRDRYLFRRHAKDFEETAGAREHWYGEGADMDMDALLAAILHVEAGSWKMAEGVAISGNPRETGYYRQLLPWLATHDQLVALVLYIQEEPVAYCLCYRCDGTYGCMKGTYRTEFAKLGVGHHAQDQVVLGAADAGAREFDFLGDADPYKLAWSPTTRPHSDYFLYAPRGRGRWLGMAQQLRNRLSRDASRTGKPATG